METALECTLLCCDDCDRAWCRACLARHVGDDYAALAEDLEVWRCVSAASRPRRPGCGSAAARGGDDDDEGEATDATRAAAEAALMAFESELADAQELLEGESVDAVRGAVYRELEGACGADDLGAAVAREVSDGESEATYDGISDDEARASHRAAEAYLADARPIKRKRGAGGATRLEGAVGASGFEARRAEELGATASARVRVDGVDAGAARVRGAEAAVVRASADHDAAVAGGDGVAEAHVALEAARARSRRGAVPSSTRRRGDARVHVGNEARASVGGALEGPADVRAYVVAATADPATGDAPRCRPTRRATDDAADRTSTGASDDPILVDDEDLVAAGLADAPRKKRALAAELGDDELCEHARRLERAAPPPAPPLPPEDDDDYDDLGDVAVVAQRRAPSGVVVPKYLGYRLKEHQVEAARFLYDQTVESLDLLEDPDADAFGRARAQHGPRQDATCIAYMAALLKDPAARRRVRTCLAWQRLGGVCVVGYDFFHALVGKRGEKKRKRKKKMDLAASTPGVVEGGGCLSVDGRAVEADLNRDGSIQWEGERFASASAFAKRVLKVDKVNGHAKVTYKGESLVAVRDRADDLEDDEDEPEADAAADDPDVVACRRCLQDPGPDVVVLDEAHTIKNPKSKRHEALSRIRTKRRVALTGTPLQNNLLEYHTMISYVRGAVLGTRRDLIKDFVLRRDESLLAKEMGKTEYLPILKLGNHPLTHLLTDGDGASPSPRLSAGDARVEAALRERDGAGAAAEAAAGAACAKTLLLFELLSECLKRGDKMVVFTQSLATLDFLEHALASETWGGLLDPNRDRIQDALDHGGAAGNMGINLVAANRVVLFDACWNPAIDRQALFRCFRYGQTKHVYIYRLVAQGFERRVYQRANQKEFLALKVVDDAALERLYDFADLGDVARLGDGGGDDASSVGSDDDCDAAVEDGALAAALAARGDVVASTVVTDDLMRENEDERLDAGLRDDAMDEYEREKAGRPSREEEARRDAAIRAEQLRRQQAAEEANRARVARELAARRHREALLALPPGWQLYRRESDNKPYYHHAASGQTVWQHPGGWSPAGAAGAPAPAAPAPAPTSTAPALAPSFAAPDLGDVRARAGLRAVGRARR
ncbi:hypothetical protein JL722_10155 [Aureococcus anophagefferens]|nr:hypothetical protein JL722_10155 [Aureococcus anophagefferens]